MGCMEYVAKVGDPWRLSRSISRYGILRIVAGTGQISEGIKRAGLAVGSGPSWIYFLPLVRGESPLNNDEISTSKLLKGLAFDFKPWRGVVA